MAEFLEEFFFAFEGASHPEGPFRHLLVTGLKGREAMGELFDFEVDLVRPEGAPDVDVAELVGRSAALRFFTRIEPASRILHGVVAEAEELGETDLGTRYRVRLAPPIVRASMTKKSIVYLDKTLRQIVEEVLTRPELGAGLEKGGAPPEPDDGDMARYSAPRLSFAWRSVASPRLDDPAARPYCVQYGESDLDFVARLLEEEGIGYHFEHGRGACVLVLSDHDGGRRRLPELAPLGPNARFREVFDFRASSRLRPTSVALVDYGWRKPDLAMRALAPPGGSDFAEFEYPGRFEHDPAAGEALAGVREERLGSERTGARASSRCRAVGAGDVFTLDHPQAKFSGDYLVTEARYEARQPGSFGAARGDEDPFRVLLSLVRCGERGKKGESRFRPARRTPRPRITGSQTAVVTAEPTAREAEINVGGPEDVGCVRLRFHWDVDEGRLEKEPSSAWVRVVQVFAGKSHGALFHPRVGDEVVVEFLDGDPDRPIVVGRVYNARNVPPESPEKRPTYSALKSLTSPYDGNFNMLAFEDAQGKEEITIHAARDFTSHAKRNSSRSVGVDDATTVLGSQTISVSGSQSTSAGSVSVSAGTTFEATSGADMTLRTRSHLAATAVATATVQAGTELGLLAGEDLVARAGGSARLAAAAQVDVNAPEVILEATGNLKAHAPWVDISAGTKARFGAGAVVEVNAGATLILTASGGPVTIKASGPVVLEGADVVVKGGKVDVSGGADVSIKGSSVNLNC